MGYAKTESSAKRRVAMKRALRKIGVSLNSNITTAKLEELYKKHLNKAPPNRNKYE